MNIFEIIGLTLLISIVVFFLSWGFCCLIQAYMEKWSNDYWFLTWLISLIIAICAWMGFTFVGIGIYTEEERIFIARFEAQKQTIEMSLDNENLSGLEKIELVKKATELNGELAERKSRFNMWHYVSYDNSMYDNIEPISLEIKDMREIYEVE